MLVGAAVVIGVWWSLRRHPVTLSRVVGNWLRVAVAVVAVVVIAVAASRSSGPLTIQAARGASSGSVRATAGTGGGTLAHLPRPPDRRRRRGDVLARAPASPDASSVAPEPHDLPLQFLAELGLVGGLLLAALFVSGGAAVVSAVRRNGLAANALAAVVLA